MNWLTYVLSASVTSHGKRRHQSNDLLRVLRHLAPFDFGRIKIRREAIQDQIKVSIFVYEKNATVDRPRVARLTISNGHKHR